jgi:hypothetical protein
VRRYQQLWNSLKRDQTAEVVLHKDLAQTVIQGLRKIKSDENVKRRSVGLVPFSKLLHKEEVVRESRGQVKLTFWFLYDTRV